MGTMIHRLVCLFWVIFDGVSALRKALPANPSSIRRINHVVDITNRITQEIERIEDIKIINEPLPKGSMPVKSPYHFILLDDQKQVGPGSWILTYGGIGLGYEFLLIAAIPILYGQLIRRILKRIIYPRLKFSEEVFQEYPLIPLTYLQQTRDELRVTREKRNGLDWLGTKFLIRTSDSFVDLRELMSMTSEGEAPKSPWQLLRVLAAFNGIYTQHRAGEIPEYKSRLPSTISKVAAQVEISDSFMSKLNEEEKVLAARLGLKRKKSNASVTLKKPPSQVKSSRPSLLIRRKSPGISTPGSPESSIVGIKSEIKPSHKYKAGGRASLSRVSIVNRQSQRKPQLQPQSPQESQPSPQPQSTPQPQSPPQPQSLPRPRSPPQPQPPPEQQPAQQDWAARYQPEGFKEIVPVSEDVPVKKKDSPSKAHGPPKKSAYITFKLDGKTFKYKPRVKETPESEADIPDTQPDENVPKKSLKPSIAPAVPVTTGLTVDSAEKRQLKERILRQRAKRVEAAKEQMMAESRVKERLKSHEAENLAKKNQHVTTQQQQKLEALYQEKLKEIEEPDKPKVKPNKKNLAPDPEPVANKQPDDRPKHRKQPVADRHHERQRPERDLQPKPEARRQELQPPIDNRRQERQPASEEKRYERQRPDVDRRQERQLAVEELRRERQNFYDQHKIPPRKKVRIVESNSSRKPSVPKLLVKRGYHVGQLAGKRPGRGLGAKSALPVVDLRATASAASETPSGRYYPNKYEALIGPDNTIVYKGVQD